MRMINVIPKMEFSPKAKPGLTAPVAAMKRAPIGPVPIARLITPRALPRISGLVSRMMSVACMGLKPEEPSPRIINVGRDMTYHFDNAKSISANNDKREPPTYKRPWYLILIVEATIMAPARAPKPDAPWSIPASNASTCSVSLAITRPNTARRKDEHL